ncbi:MAG: hypothetical protein VYE58_03410 [Pseudomonadota bacterium]|nr:hypothetical protein [Pseudomonadota bacterium]
MGEADPPRRRPRHRRSQDAAWLLRQAISVCRRDRNRRRPGRHGGGARGRPRRGRCTAGRRKSRGRRCPLLCPLRRRRQDW